MGSPSRLTGAPTLRAVDDPEALRASKPGRLLASIRRDMDIKRVLFDQRKRNEEILALDYEGSSPGGATIAKNLRKNVLNLPYRYVRWLESQATSKQLVVKVSRDAGEGQRPGGAGDNLTGEWVATTLKRAAYEGGIERELRAVIAEACARGTSVLKIGYHKEVIDLQESREAGKDAQSVAPEAIKFAKTLDAGMSADVSALEAKPGQANHEIAAGLGRMVESPEVQDAVGTTGVQALLARKQSHDDAAFLNETDDKPISSTRMTRNKVYVRKLRVGEDVGWDPSVYDVEDAKFWWERQTMTVAEVRESHLFTEEFKQVVRGYDGWNVSGVMSGGQTPSTDSMGSDARQAQSEPVLEDDERIVEFFLVYQRRPDMKAGGVRHIVCAETPDIFVEADDSNPNADDNGYSMIPGFYPYFDFTPILETISRPERTVGIAPIQVGMPQFEQIAEGIRLVHESALRHSLRFYDVHPAHKDNKELLNALKNGVDGYANIMHQAQFGTDGKPQPSVTPIQFTGNTQEIERYVNLCQSHWIMVMGMPPAVLQGVGTAETLGQDKMGLAAGERESSSIVEYFEKRTACALSGLRGLIRGNYDDEDFIPLLGEQGAAVMKAWQIGTADDGDQITVTFGARAMAQQAVDRKQIMEAITLSQSQTVNVLGVPLPKYDTQHLFEELHRSLGVGAPKIDTSTQRQLETAVLQLAAIVKQATGADVTGGGGQPGKPGGGPKGGDGEDRRTKAGPNPAEGDGPSQENIGAGANRGTLSNQVPNGTTTY